MIKGTFKFGGDIIEVVVDKSNILFSDVSSGTITTVEGLKLSKIGVEEQFPDLKGKDNWREEATKRFKEHTKKFKKETEKLDYIRSELTKHGYESMMRQRSGFRPERW